MSGMVNSHPLNGAALATWVKAATVAASVALTATAEPTCIRGGVASFTGDASASATAIRVFPGASTGASQALGSAYPWYQGAGEAVLVGRATALVACERTIYAEAYGTATVTGSAIAESEIGEVIAAAEFTIEAEATRNRPGRVVITAGATIDPPAVVFGQTVNLLATSTARAEASVQLSGESFWRHDGYVEASATGVLSPQVTWSIQSLPLEMGFTIAAEAVRQRPATAALSVSCLGTVEGLAGVPGEVDATVQATGEAIGTRVHGATVAGAASATARIAVAPSQGHAALASAGTSLSGAATPNKNTVGLAQVSTTSQGDATGIRQTWGEAVLEASILGDASGGQNHPATVDATMGCIAAPVTHATQWYATVDAAAAATATSVEHATQHYAEAVATATTLEISAVQARSNPSLAYLYVFGTVTANSQALLVGAVNATAGAELAQSLLATQHWGESASQGSLTVTETSYYIRGGAVNATAGAALIQALLATSHKGEVLAVLEALGTANGDRARLATVDALVGATGRAFGLRRGDLNAPPERSMILSYEPRGMIVPEAERTLWVPV